MGLISRRGEHDEDQVDQLSIAGLDSLDGKPDDIVYELDDWSGRGRALLRERLDTLGVPHTWEGDTTLVVSAPDEAWVERIMDQVEEDMSQELDPDVSHVAYDLTGWDDQNRGLLLDALEDEAVPYGVDGDELLVHEIDEQRVDEMVDALLRPDAAPAPSADASEIMGELFVAADRLVHDPGDHEGAQELAASNAHFGGPPPYGMDQRWWDDVGAQARALAALIDVGQRDDTAVVAAAEGLRDTLRPYV